MGLKIVARLSSPKHECAPRKLTNPKSVANSVDQQSSEGMCVGHSSSSKPNPPPVPLGS